MKTYLKVVALATTLAFLLLSFRIYLLKSLSRVKKMHQDHPGYYTTGDGCKIDKDGFVLITGIVITVENGK
jgi:acyl-coenzyme A synthetase/AMP-(fatty) acid ligase